MNITDAHISLGKGYVIFFNEQEERTEFETSKQSYHKTLSFFFLSSLGSTSFLSVSNKYYLNYWVQFIGKQ